MPNNLNKLSNSVAEVNRASLLQIFLKCVSLLLTYA